MEEVDPSNLDVDSLEERRRQLLQLLAESGECSEQSDGESCEYAYHVGSDGPSRKRLRSASPDGDVICGAAPSATDSNLSLLCLEDGEGVSTNDNGVHTTDLSLSLLSTEDMEESSANDNNVNSMDLNLSLLSKVDVGESLTNDDDVHTAEQMDTFSPPLEDLEDVFSSNIGSRPGANGDRIQKRVLVRLEGDHFDSLPEGWFRVTHNSGMPFYLHRPTRVVSTTRPFYLGGQSFRNATIPLTAIPCLHERRLQKREETEKKMRADLLLECEKATDSAQKNALLQRLNAPIVKVEREEDYTLSCDDVHNYSKSLFAFKTISVCRGARRMRMEQRKRPCASRDDVVDDELGGDDKKKTSINGLSLIHIPTVDNRFNKRSFLMNPEGRSSITILHEFVQRALKGSVTYEVDETRNVSTPYRAKAIASVKRSTRVELASSVQEKLSLLAACNDLLEGDEEMILLGIGEGCSKKIAKLKAAQSAVQVLIPELKFTENHLGTLSRRVDEVDDVNIQVMGVLADMDIEDDRVAALSARHGVPKPLALLNEALARSIAWNGERPTENVELIGGQRTRVTMRLAHLEAKGEANGAKQAKQRAAQTLLRLMHPDLCKYGSLLQLYASESEKAQRAHARKQHNEVVRMQGNGSALLPNDAVLGKLKAEMQRVVVGATRGCTFAVGGHAHSLPEFGLLRLRHAMDCGLWCVFSERRRHVEKLWRRRLLVTSDERRARRRFLRLMRGFDAEDVEVIRKAVESAGLDAKACAPGPPMDERAEEEQPQEDSGLIPQIDRPMSMPYLCCKLWRWKDLQVDAALHRLEALPWCRFGRVTINNATVSCCNPYHYALWIRAESGCSDEESTCDANHVNSVGNGHISFRSAGVDWDVPSQPPSLPPSSSTSPAHSSTSSPPPHHMVHHHATAWGRLSRWERKERVGEVVSLCGSFAAVGLLTQSVHDAQSVCVEWDLRNKVSFALIRQPDPIGSENPEDVWLYNSGTSPLFLSICGYSTKPESLRRLSPGYCIRVHKAEPSPCAPATERIIHRPPAKDPALAPASLVISVARGWGTAYNRYINDTPVRYEVTFVT